MSTVAKRPPRPVQKRCALREKEIRAIELAARGLNQKEIGDQLGLTRSAISKMLIRTERRLADMLKERGEEIKASQTAKLQHIYREAMQAWQRSKQGASSVKTVFGAKGDERTETTVREQAGDPRFLDQARASLSDVRKIWGLDADARDNDGNTNVVVNVKYATDFFGHAATIDVDGHVTEDTLVVTDESDGHCSQDD